MPAAWSVPPGSIQRTSPVTSMGSGWVGMRNRICNRDCKREAIAGLDEDAAQRNVPGGGVVRTVAADDLDVQAPSVAGICATEVV